MPTLDVQGMLFDLDGVLVDSTAGVNRVWWDWAVRNRLDPEETTNIAHGRRSIDTVRLLTPHLDAEAELADLEAREIAESYDIAVFDGAGQLLTSIPPERLAIVTSGTRALATTRLKAAGLPIPERMITADDIECGKPDPEPYLRGAALLHLPPARCAVVEDAPSGIRSAREAGVGTIFSVSTTYPASQLGEATVQLPALVQLRAKIMHDIIRLSW
jgi:sugar-phosphatase